jgi:hypothetical protein
VIFERRVDKATQAKKLQADDHYPRFYYLVFGNIINTLIRIRLAISAVIIVGIEFFARILKLTGNKSRTRRNQ